MGIGQESTRIKIMNDWDNVLLVHLKLQNGYVKTSEEAETVKKKLEELAGKELPIIETEGYDIEIIMKGDN